MRKTLVLLAASLLLPSAVMAEEPPLTEPAEITEEAAAPGSADIDKTPMEVGKTEKDKTVLPAGQTGGDFLETAENTGRVREKTWEIQADYMEHHFYRHRHIDNYSIHAYRKMGSHGSISWYQGLTATWNNGYITEHGRHRSSDSWGIGPSVMGRWERRISGKLYGSLDVSGSLLFYNKAFPAGGRAYGFMWRYGPRLTYKYNDRDSLSMAYLWMHCSNGMEKRNPGYNAAGCSLAWSHTF